MRYFKEEENRISLVDEQENMIGEIHYVKLPNNKIDINYVFVHPEYRGTGVANDLMDYAYDYFISNKKEIMASCPYAKRWIEKYQKQKEGITVIIK